MSATSLRVEEPAAFAKGLATVFLIAGLLFIALGDGPERLFGGIVGLGVGLVQARRAYFARTRVQVEGERLIWQGEGQTLELAASEVDQIQVERSTHPIRRPTRYLLAVRFQGQPLMLAFRRHHLFGGRAMRDAQSLASALGRPVVDEQGERWRASSFPLMRPLGRGQDWQVVLLALVLALGTGLLVLAWLQG